MQPTMIEEGRLANTESKSKEGMNISMKTHRELEYGSPLVNRTNLKCDGTKVWETVN